ncbi:MAG: hypothetical protein HY000_12600, partial [Planctomycetes bacterium]|nr:hypothetical protein [Planctomycetota bacterium]
LLKGFLPFATGKTFRTAPAIFRESLIFPYFKGMVFILHLTNRGGWEPVNAAFRDPPTSTEQILHPEKYREPRDVPTAIALPDMKAVIDEAWKKLGENVLGEFQISILLTGVKDAAQASAGWDGDRYAVFEGEAGKLGLVWLSTWDRPEDAKEFATAYARYLQEKKLATPSAPPLRKALPAPPLRKGGQGGVKAKDAAKPSEEGKTPESPAADLTLRVSRNGRVYHIQRKDADVAVIEGFSDAETDRLLEIVFNAEKKPKVFPEQAKK